MSFAWVSSAKWPVSKKWILASGMSRLNASAPRGRKKGSFFPHTARKRGFVRPEVIGECRVQGDVALVVAEEAHPRDPPEVERFSGLGMARISARDCRSRGTPFDACVSRETAKRKGRPMRVMVI